MAARNRYRSLPSVDRILSDERVRALANGGEPGIATIIVRQAIESARLAIAGGSEAPTEDQLVESVLGLAAAAFEPSLRPVINATGVILHTNLGRAPLGSSAPDHIGTAAKGYSNLEFNLADGERGRRDVHLDRLFRKLLSEAGEGAAELNASDIATVVVNNNAAAVLIALNSLAEGGEVIVSRGELVEIGGSFRIPDVMAKSGAMLREVGTTNRTRLADYERAINEKTRLLLRVHRGLVFIHR